mgnify:CR=1 FL=1|tara:strand:- start:15932 stop:16435 length:504 start_codon:yes stop_codon:yes gene_type:complete
MAKETIGTGEQLQFQLPKEGTTDWAPILREAFEKIATHDHSATTTNQNGQGVAVLPDLAESLRVFTQTIAATSTAEAFEDETGAAWVFDTNKDVAEIKYKVKREDSSNPGTFLYQFGTIECIKGSSIVDSYIGTNLNITFTWNSGNTGLEVTGTAGDIFSYNIKFNQ